MKNNLMVVMLLVGLFAGACSWGGDGNESLLTAPAMRMLITERNCPSLEVLIGTQVTWENRGTQVHVVQSEPADDGSRVLDSGELQVGDSFSFTFPEAGAYNYQCDVDGSMTGKITVR